MIVACTQAVTGVAVGSTGVGMAAAAQSRDPGHAASTGAPRQGRHASGLG